LDEKSETGHRTPDTKVILHSVQRCYAVHWTDNYLFRPWGPRATGDPVTRRSNIPIITPLWFTWVVTSALQPLKLVQLIGTS